MRLIPILILFSLLFIQNVLGQLFTETEFQRLYKSGEESVYQGDFEAVLKNATQAKKIADKLNNSLLLAKSYYLLARSQPITGANKPQADNNFQKAMLLFADIEQSEETKLVLWQILTDYSNLDSNPDYFHTPEEFITAIETLKKINRFSPNHPASGYRLLELKTFIYLSNFFAVRGHHLTQIVWLEEALSLLPKQAIDPLTFEIEIRLQRAYRRIGEYEKALQILNNISQELEKTTNNFRKLIFLRQLIDFYADVDQRTNIFQTIEKSIPLAEKVKFKVSDFYLGKIYQLLLDKKFDLAQSTLNILQKKLDSGETLENQIHIPTIKAVLSGYKGNEIESDKFFNQSRGVLKEDFDDEWTNQLLYYYWRSDVLTFQKRFGDLIIDLKQAEKTALKNQSKDSLPFIYRNLANAYFRLKDFKNADLYNQKAITFIESKRKSENPHISIGVMEMLYESYQLDILLKEKDGKIFESFFASDLMKSRWLNDKLTENSFTRPLILNEKIRNDLKKAGSELLENPRDENLSEKLYKTENAALFYEQIQNNPIEPDLISRLENSLLDSDSAIVSYSFTKEGKLLAFIWQKGQSLKLKQLDLSKHEIDELAQNIDLKLKNFIYLKSDAKNAFDKLLRPLEINANHLIIIPDQSIWKIPFQALSPDGKKYLIETTKISYSPSVSILLNQINHSLKPRESAQVFANSTYNNLYLKYADLEATEVGRLLNVRPFLNTSTKQFLENSQQADILHFSLHSELNSDEPFNSYLAFNENSQNDGKMTVENLLNLQLKKGSLVFLASCNTNNVFNGEGLVSLAWGMMGAGASTVISSQWEANDKSTSVFTKNFYKNYKVGNSASLSMQKAAMEMIYDKNNEFNQPYFWAQFTLLGDFR